MSLLSVARLAKTYGGAAALRDASLTIEAGEVHALMGENGAGKSTLIRILAGVVQADSGEITVAGEPASIANARDAYRLGLRFLHQELNVASRLSVAENIFLGRAYPTRWGGLVDWAALRDRASAALAALSASHIAPETIVGRLAVGDRMIVKIASTFVDDASAPGRIFVMDEPTAALTSEESERLFRILDELQRRRAGVLYVSHRIEEVLRISNRITVLRDGVSQPPIATAEATREMLIERMTGRTRLEAAARPRQSTNARVALSVDRLTGKGLEEISFDVREGEILGLAGLGDAGGDRLLRALMGAMTGGSVAIAGEGVRPRGPAEGWRRGLAYVPRERRSEGLLLSQSISDNVALPHLNRLSHLRLFLNRLAERAETAAVGRRVRLRATGPRQRAWRLSGGNQQKVMFARAVAGAPRLLLLDEPTRGVDVAARFDIHALLREIAAAGAAVVIASSDREELLALCSRIAILTDGRLSRIVPAEGLTAARLLALCYGDDRV
ncbi:MAG: sugar ABC transporter ATP-binding protein [Hyphomicrobiales bacterium]|nr:sugar ABC transporter ATP-binding protein [Hyphomicrobiales bacterium]